MRLAGARRSRGIDVAYVIADLIGAQLRQLCTDAHPGGSTIAGEHPRHQPVDRDVECFDQRLGDRARTLTGRGGFEQRRFHRALTGNGFSCSCVSRSSRSSSGAVTALSTLSRSSSAVTPSLRAS